MKKQMVHGLGVILLAMFLTLVGCTPKDSGATGQSDSGVSDVGSDVAADTGVGQDAPVLNDVAAGVDVLDAMLDSDVASVTCGEPTKFTGGDVTADRTLTKAPVALWILRRERGGGRVCSRRV